MLPNCNFKILYFIDELIVNYCNVFDVAQDIAVPSSANRAHMYANYGLKVAAWLATTNTVMAISSPPQIRKVGAYEVNLRGSDGKNVSSAIFTRYF